MPSDPEVDKRLPLQKYPDRSCANCGFLADYHGRGFSAEFKEANEWSRVSGWFGEGHPTCFVLAPDTTLREEIEARLPSAAPTDRYGQDAREQERPATNAAVIQRDRNCSEATIWRPGYTPKEHQEMLDRQWKIEQETEVREAVWAREDKRDDDAEKRHTEQMTEMRGQHRTGLLIFGGAVTTAIVLSSIIGSMIQANWIEKPWGHDPAIITPVQPTPVTLTEP